MGCPSLAGSLSQRRGERRRKNGGQKKPAAGNLAEQSRYTRQPGPNGTSLSLAETMKEPYRHIIPSARAAYQMGEKFSSLLVMLCVIRAAVILCGAAAGQWMPGEQVEAWPVAWFHSWPGIRACPGFSAHVWASPPKILFVGCDWRIIPCLDIRHVGYRGHTSPRPGPSDLHPAVWEHFFTIFAPAWGESETGGGLTCARPVFWRKTPGVAR